MRFLTTGSKNPTCQRLSVWWLAWVTLCAGTLESISNGQDAAGDPADTCQAAAAHADWQPKQSVIESFQKRRGEFNFVEANVPKYQLPDPLILDTEDGPRKVNTAQAWNAHGRGQLLQLFREHVYGVRPSTDYRITYETVSSATNMFGIGAMGSQVRATIVVGQKSHTFEFVVVIPQSNTPVPAIVHINNRYLIPLEKVAEEYDPFWPVESIVRSGCATAGFHTSHIDPDRRDGYDNGIRSLLDDADSKPLSRWKSISAWGWGASRVLDYLRTLEAIDGSRVAVAGNSRAGKTALWAAAEDERFRIAYSNESGCGGAALSRRAFGETVARINKSFPHWFCDRFKTYAAREEELPVDQHALIGLIAPRSVYVASADEDLWADPRGEYTALVAAGPVFELFGLDHITDPVMPPLNQPRHVGSTGYHIRTGAHNLTQQDWDFFLQFVKTHWPVSALSAQAQIQDDQSRSGVSSPTVYRPQIAAVADAEVETTVGHLPRLPVTLGSQCAGGVDGPDVRVIWPAPKDNGQVAQSGTYSLTGRVPGTDLRPKAVVRVLPPSDRLASAPARLLEPFPLSAVTLNRDDQGRDTPLIKNRDKFISGLAAANPDRFLYMFRDAFGQKQPDGARPLGGWDSQITRLRGHASGHYLSAIAQAYAGSVADELMHADFKQKMDYMVDVLYDLSQRSGNPSSPGGQFNADPASVPPGPGRDGYTSDLSKGGIRTDYWNWGRGFISAYPPDQFIMLEQGATYGGRNDQIWAPYYTLHKILAGLLDCYEIGGNEKALDVAKGMGLWVHARLRRVPTETRIRMWNRYIAGEFGGMNEAMAWLYRLTDDKRFLECAQMFDNIDFFFGDAEHTHGLACNVDTVRGKHANQHIPQITGALEVYRANRELPYFHIADNFWHICTNSYMYVIGGVAGALKPNNAECFTAEPDSLFKNGFSPGGQNETCATYNLLKLSRQLFMYSPDPKYMDYYEQAFYNHILASVAESNPGNTYHVPLNPGARKRFGNAAMDGFSCCNGTALESSTKLQDSIYFRSADNGKLYVNLFVPSTLYWEERGVQVTQATSFPYSDRTRLLIDGEGDFAVLVRVPQWASSGIHMSINGKRQLVEATPGGYIVLDRTWQSGDEIQLQVPFSFRLSRIMDQPNIAGLFYGPVLLAVEESSSRSAWRKVKLDVQDFRQSIEGDPSSLRFTIGDLQLKPFFETYGRYSVYLDITPE